MDNRKKFSFKVEIYWRSGVKVYRFVLPAFSPHKKAKDMNQNENQVESKACAKELPIRISPPQDEYPFEALFENDEFEKGYSSF
jgi:hypothetical protein